MIDSLALPGVSLAYQSDERLAVAIDLPGVQGEGSLVRHGDRQWRGTAHVDLQLVSVTGLAILDEGGSGGAPPGLIVVLAAEFAPPIQLSFGFALIGVGGVVGVNRAPDHERLREATTSSDISRLLFPGDSEAEADQLLPVIDRCFPPRAGGFVVGPTVKVGWGTPAIISATVGLLVSDRDVTILGRVAIGLPFEQAALIRLEANVVGRADASGLAIDATLSNSHIVGIPIDGDIRMRMLTTGGGLFALSAGGFHPSFTPPAGMAGMRRVGMHLSCGGVLHARLEAYLAITTNSAQFGARVDIQVGADGWGVRGHASFDTLFQFDPFRFEVGFTAMVAVEAAGVDLVGVNLSGQLSGPAPWRISGRASVKLLFVRIPVPFPNLTWGENRTVALPPAADPVAALVHELSRPEHWSTTAHADTPLVRLRARAATTDGTVHPWATIGFRQQRIPIDTPLTRMDGIPLGAPITLRVAGVEGTRLGEGRSVEAFVRQQFFDVDERERLAGAGFTPYPAGFDLETRPPRSGEGSWTTIEDYEVCVREATGPVYLAPPPPPPDRPVGLSHAALRAHIMLATRHRLLAPLALKAVIRR